MTSPFARDDYRTRCISRRADTAKWLADMTLHDMAKVTPHPDLRLSDVRLMGAKS